MVILRDWRTFFIPSNIWTSTTLRCTATLQHRYTCDRTYEALHQPVSKYYIVDCLLKTVQNDSFGKHKPEILYRIRCHIVMPTLTMSNFRITAFNCSKNLFIPY